MSFGDAIKEHWEKGSAFIAIAFETALAFQKDLAEISLGTRFVIGGLAGLWATLSVTEILRREPRKGSIGFGNKIEEVAKNTWWYTARVILILVMCAVSVFLLRQIATFHNLLVLQKPYSVDQTAGTVEIQPAHRPSSVTVNLSTSQSPPMKIVYIAPASWNDKDPVQWQMKNDSPFGVTLILPHFRSPQVFGIWYRLAGDPRQLDVEVIPDPAEVRVIRGGQLDQYRRNIWIFGGVLCLTALLFWSYRSSWFRPLS